LNNNALRSLRQAGSRRVHCSYSTAYAEQYVYTDEDSSEAYNEDDSSEEKEVGSIAIVLQIVAGG
jgi:hypothetical protein